MKYYWERDNLSWIALVRIWNMSINPHPVKIARVFIGNQSVYVFFMIGFSNNWPPCILVKTGHNVVAIFVILGSSRMLLTFVAKLKTGIETV
jgi:hypothetical protein